MRNLLWIFLMTLFFSCRDQSESIVSSAENISTANSSIFFVQNDSSELPEIKIGSQIWSKRNLNVNHFRNGDIIPEAKSIEEWKEAAEKGSPAWCYYENDPASGRLYGKIYNWYAVADTRGLAPDGWKIPSDSAWTELINFVGGTEQAGVKLKHNEGWKENGQGSNFIGFSALPGGNRDFFGFFYDQGYFSDWWTSTEANVNAAWAYGFYYKRNKSYRFNSNKSFGFAVRCIKEQN